jgi:hypothetical protein
MDDLEVRDLFAMLAMCGMVAHNGVQYKGKVATLDDALGAKRAYEIADAMLKAREYQEPEEGIAAITTRKI